MRIMIVSDAWEPQVNGVVRTLKMTGREAASAAHAVEVLSPEGFRSVPCPTYTEIRLSLTSPDAVARRIDAFKPDCLHIATEGPLGWCARATALRRGWAFTTAYHSRFPQYLHARTRLPTRWSYAVLRRFHNAGAATLVPTATMASELRAQGFERPRLWSRGVDLSVFRPDGERLPHAAVTCLSHLRRIQDPRTTAAVATKRRGEAWRWVSGVTFIASEETSRKPNPARTAFRCPKGNRANGR